MAESVDQEAINQMIQGKRHLLIKDFYSAVQSFEKVCQVLDVKYGKGSDECGDAYLNYGIALLELARQETGANEGLVNAKINDPSESESEGDEDEEEEDEEAAGENEEGEGTPESGEQNAADDEGKKTDNEESVATSDKDEDDQEKKVNGAAVNGEGSSSGEKSDVNEKPKEGADNRMDVNDDQAVESPSDLDQPSTSSGIKKSEDDDDEPTNTEISWEVLTMARQIFERQVKSGQDIKYKLSETLQKLGEIATEWENNELAIELLTDCLNLRKESLPDDDRLIAETHYHIGNAHSLIAQLDKANEAFQRAIDVIKMRIENKKKALEDENQPEDNLRSIRDEIKDLEDVLPEMLSRIEDKQDQMMATVQDALKMAATEKDEEERLAKMKAMESKPVNNISHLVKRKNVDNTDAGSKKLCNNDHQAKEVTKSDVVPN